MVEGVGPKKSGLEGYRKPTPKKMVETLLPNFLSRYDETDCDICLQKHLFTDETFKDEFKNDGEAVVRVVGQLKLKPAYYQKAKVGIRLLQNLLSTRAGESLARDILRAKFSQSFEDKKSIVSIVSFAKSWIDEGELRQAAGKPTAKAVG